ncbi:MAG TPA: M20/M25/M40 family metallo-hydrolase [Gaiellaceae bacterium]|nr:M20/M25/M40 family metallo-hydrolase [Gaiellaceae bacterium]
MADDVLALFLELAAIPSPPGEERAVADRVLAYLRDLGVEPEEDAAGAEIGSTIGNLYVRVPGTAPGLPLFFCAHLDTVPPEGPLEPVVADGLVRNAGGTILGADNKAAVASMLHAARRLLAERRAHAGIELVFTAKEEVGLKGAYAFDASRLEARTGFVYDQQGPIGEIVLGTPTARALMLRFHGRAAHAGMVPEEGRSAIAAAARAVADMRLGRLDEETTANVGQIFGGSARNIVPEWCTLEAEARSHDRAKLDEVVQELLDAAAFAASVSDCELQTEVVESYRSYRFKREDPAVQLAAAALARCGRTVSYGLTGGGADANAFNERGLACVNLANGMAEIHSSAEHIAVADLEGMVDVTLALLDAALA